MKDILKKWWFWVIVVVVLAVIVLGVLYLVEKNRLERMQETIQTEGPEILELFSEGKVDEGMSQCEEIVGRGFCYALLYSHKMKNNETVTEELCSNIEFDMELSFFHKDEERRAKGSLMHVQEDCMENING